MENISAKHFYERLNKHPELMILDVREPWEFEEGHIEGAVNIPLGDIQRYDGDKAIPVYVICRSGGRSLKACYILVGKGYHPINIEGGMLGYEEEKRKHS